MDGFSREPLGALAAHFEVVGQHLLSPCRIVAKMRDYFVILVQQRDAGVQVGHQHDFALNVNVRRKEESVERVEVLAIHIEPLQVFVGPVSDHQLGIAVPIVQPLAVRSFEFAVLGSRALVESVESAVYSVAS